MDPIGAFSALGALPLVLPAGAATGTAQAVLEAARIPVLALDLVGVFVFALSGGLAAVRHRMDVVGVVVLACAAGLGGGIIRDVLLGAVPPVGISDWRLLAAAGAAALVAFWFHPAVPRIRRVVLVLDAVGLGVFVVAGTAKGLGLDAPVLAAVVVGVVTGVGGGMVRDLLTGQVPEVLGRTELYATPAVLGAVAYAALERGGLGGPPATVGCVLLVVLVRLWAIRYRVTAPTPRDPGGAATPAA
ncbi:trimeric intracellular cation channel family protein [Thalassiella azotivora]